MTNQTILVLLCACLSYITANPTCAPLKPGMINVHLVCHTHDDVGWLKTVDQYYYGAKKRITWVGVQYILDSVLVSLEKDASRKFIYVESAFFHRWWEEQSSSVKARVRTLVHNGQLEFIGGGWCMNDEAAAHYNAIIDQMSYGLTMLRTYFGKEGIPRVAWQIDPFGHSREQASLFAQMGFDGLFLGRIDHDDKDQRWANKSMEMVWKGSASLGSAGHLFTGILPRTYSPPVGFCFDLLCADDPIMDDPQLEDYNLDQKVEEFIRKVHEQQEGYATSNIVMTMGEDFNYVYAESWYKNLDKLIKGVNGLQAKGSKINLMYSTPSCYLDALHAANATWPTKSDDFFPYASDPHAYWTGYFTSRPALKGFIRHSNNILQAAKQLSTFTGLGSTAAVIQLKKAMAVAQHHDAVTGTAKQHVTDDYNQRLAAGIAHNYQQFSSAFNTLLTKAGHPDRDYTFCPLLNVTACSYSEDNGQAFLVSVYNPLGRVTSQYIRVPISTYSGFKVTDNNGNSVEAQVVPIAKCVQGIPGRDSKAQFELVFLAKDLSPLAVAQFHVYQSSNPVILIRQTSRNINYHHNKDITLKKGDLWMTIDGSTNSLKSIGLNSDKQSSIEVTQDWLWYAGANGDNSHSTTRASGAYIFRPNGTAHMFNSVKITAVYDGVLVSEVHQEWAPWVTQVLRLYRDKRHIEIEWLVGPIPVQDGVGKEIINRINFHQMKTSDTFYTDANGREMIKRVKNYRETWTLNSSEAVSQNYYPVTSRMILASTNDQGQSALLNDRAQGGTSLKDGDMELMVHRRLLHDDAFGVGEALNETAFGTGLVVRGKHYLMHSIFATDECDFACQHRSLAQEVLLQPIVSFSAPPAHKYSWWKFGRNTTPAIQPLPLNIHLLTLDSWDKKTWLLRLEHIFETDESPQFSVPVKIDVKTLFPGWSVMEVREVTLGANQWTDEANRLQWRTEDEPSQANINQEGPSVDHTTFTWNPMQIRSFLLTMSKA